MEILYRYCQGWRDEAKEHNVRIKSSITDFNQVSIYMCVVEQRHQVFCCSPAGLASDMCVRLNVMLERVMAHELIVVTI